MKTSFSPSQIKAGLAISVLLVLAGLCAWMGLAKLGAKKAEALDLANRMGNPGLAALLGDPAGIPRATREATELVKLTKTLGESDKDLAEQWAQGTHEATGEGQAWSKDPGKWKDHLIEVQSDLQKKAAVGNVRIDTDFYLGLDAFRQRSPAAEEVPRLALHLAVAQRLVELFISARQATEQYPTACELKALGGPGTEMETRQETPASAPAAKPGLSPVSPSPEPFFVVLQCSPEVLYDFVRKLSQDPWPFVVKDLRLANEKQTFPLRSEIAKKFSEKNSEGLTPAEPASKKKRLLEILAGEESLAVQMQVDFVPWKVVGTPKEERSLPPKP